MDQGHHCHCCCQKASACSSTKIPQFSFGSFLDAGASSSEPTQPVAASATQQWSEGCRIDPIVPGSVWQQKDAKGTPQSHVLSESQGTVTGLSPATQSEGLSQDQL